MKKACERLFVAMKFSKWSFSNSIQVKAVSLKSKIIAIIDESKN